MIVSIRVPTTSMGRASTYRKIRDREFYAFAQASAAVGLWLDGEIVLSARVALGGVATRPWRAPEAERVLAGRPLTRKLALDAGNAAFPGARPLADNRHKIELRANTVADALMIAKARAPEVREHVEGSHGDAGVIDRAFAGADVVIAATGVSAPKCGRRYRRTVLR